MTRYIFMMIYFLHDSFQLFVHAEGIHFFYLDILLLITWQYSNECPVRRMKEQFGEHHASMNIGIRNISENHFLGVSQILADLFGKALVDFLRVYCL